MEGEAEAGSDCAARAIKLVQGACGAPDAHHRSASWVALTVLAGQPSNTLSALASLLS